MSMDEVGEEQSGTGTESLDSYPNHIPEIISCLGELSRTGSA